MNTYIITIVFIIIIIIIISNILYLFFLQPQYIKNIPKRVSSFYQVKQFYHPLHQCTMIYVKYDHVQYMFSM